MLLVVMLVLAILTERGSIALDATVADLSQASTYKTAEQAFYYTEAGIGEAKGRLMGTPAINPNFVGDPAATPNPLWSAYLITSGSWTTAQDPDYNATYTNYFPTAASQTNTTKIVNSLQTTIPYWTKIRHKREYDAELEGHTPATPHYSDADGSTAPHTAAAPGNIIYYGYYPAGATTPVQFTASATAPYAPVELLRAYGTSASSSKSIEVDLVRSIGPPVPAPVYSKGNATFVMDSTGNLNGNDYCGITGNRPPVYTKAPGTFGGNPALTGTPASPQQGSVDIDIAGHITKLKGGATILTTDQLNINFGSATNYVSVYSNTSNPLNVNGLRLENVNGYGLLLVDGDLILDDDLTWFGAVLVNGTLTLHTDPGNLTIRGLVSASTIYTDDNHPNLKYDSCQLANALKAKPMQVKKWRERS